MPTDANLISMREELASGLIACAHGLGMTGIDLRLGAKETKAVLAEATVINAEMRIARNSDRELARVSITFEDDTNARWHIVTKIDFRLWTEFRHANVDSGRFETLPGCGPSAKLTYAEYTLTLNKQTVLEA